MKLSAQEWDLLHAAAGMDMFRRLDGEGRLRATETEAFNLNHLGLLQKGDLVDHARVKSSTTPSYLIDVYLYTITFTGKLVLNEHIGAKR